ncbi:tetratricopeptide repeat protein [Muricauda sp. 2012CJ35-5]|uniref:Tetratricopeptide repeat protein n=1 Tax=Flagellimonas spongiicola TaxID=2942208 RepID=A0ABT0PQC4_9FLAO|nr:tetratricopeptide repeat protein [Allomuricauda spongiicola]MCL6273597.1 tetratricopeptide repeat protein [Allomuricauda spongiicola]
MKLTCYVTLFVFVFSCKITTLVAQTKTIDSISELLVKAKDTNRVKLLLQKGDLVRDHDKDRALAIFDESILAAKKIDYANGEIDGIHQKAITYGMAGDYVESLNYLSQGIQLAREHNNLERLSQLHKTSGIVYKRLGDYSTSLENYLNSLEIIDSLGIKNAPLHVNIGILYDLLENKEKAIEHFEKAIDEASDESRDDTENSVLANLAVMDFASGDYEAALEKNLRRAEYAKKIKNNLDLCRTYANIGGCYLKLKDWNKSEFYFQKSLKIAEQLSLKPQIALYYYNLANLRFEQERYQDAITSINENLDLVAELNEYSLFRKSHDLAFRIHQKANRLPTAIHHLNRTMAYGDSLMNATKVKEIQQLQIRHDVSLKDKELKENALELQLLNTQVASNQKRLLYLLIITLLLLVTAGLIYRQFRIKKKSYAVLEEKNDMISKQNKTIETINSELEKRMLRAQMNPHFIFNSLNSIQYLITTNDRVNALKYLTKFSKLLRQVLESSINISLVLREEMELLKIYLELESLRFDNSFKYEIKIDENLDIEEHELPMLLVQPYIENAIIHGLMPKDGDKTLRVNFKDSDAFVICEIEDNGVGIQKSIASKRKKPSRGMAITEKRIQALKKYTDQELLKIENLNSGKQTGTRVTILIPKQGIHQTFDSKQAV